jgi:AcrR family transcriptional regulator
MSANQLARRERLLRAVIGLVEGGADEDLQMKDIAERADVALGTVYRYFSSKDHLVAAALLEWARDLEHRTARRGGRAAPAAGTPAGTPAGRLVAVLDQALRAYQRRPVYARLLVMVATSTDANASACFEEMRPVVFGALGRAIDDVEPDTRHRILMVIGAVWYHCLVEWVNGRMTPADVTSMLETTAHLLLPSAPDGSAQPLPPP